MIPSSKDKILRTKIGCRRECGVDEASSMIKRGISIAANILDIKMKVNAGLIA